jgi:Tol biopolymer transport system component
MGEVYKARDTRLDRTVAVKVLPQHLSSSADVRQRFEREAKTISQLSHPHICALYDVGREGETEYLVMEYLEGETLLERLAKGPLPLDQTLRYGIEIADALDKAHRQGIVHRDLKPGNVMLTKSGVKLLDFGLAKVLQPEGPIESFTSAPTAAKDVTQEGTILGTLSYMAPEQLEGKKADPRTDIFALGAVLYEMATGKKVFSGTSRASLISAIMTSEPVAISTLQPMSPPALGRVVKTCLAKDPEERRQSAHDLGLELRTIQESSSSPVAGRSASRHPARAWLPWILAAVAAGVAVAALHRLGASRKAPGVAIHFSVPPPANWAFAYSVDTTFLAVSPDGLQLAYVASQAQGERRIFVRPLSAPEARPIPGTEGARSLFWSPDNRSVAFFTDDKLKRIDLSGGAAVPLCDVSPGIGFSGTWGRGGDILFTNVRGEAIYRVSAAGGPPVAVIHPDRSRGEGIFRWPWFLPDGRRFLFLSRGLRGSNLMLAESGKTPRALMAMQSAVQYIDPGFLVFAREGVLLGQRFDPESGRVGGEPFSIAGRVRYFLSTGAASFAVSRVGTLAFQPQGDVMRLVWLDRIGREIGTVGAPGPYRNVAISPDGRRVLFDRNRAGIGTFDIWSIDLERGTETPITSEPDTEFGAVLLPGGKSIVYSATRGRIPQLFRRDLATGKDEPLFPEGRFQVAEDVSPDGKFLLYTERGDRGAFDVWRVPLAGGGKPIAFLQSPFQKAQVRFSHDGRFVAMISNESGQPEVYVMPYPGPGERVRVSTGGARHLRWSRDGREIFYVSADRRLMSVAVQTAPALALGTPTPLFTLAREIGPRGFISSAFDVSPDGKQFLVVLPEVVADELPLDVVVNWTAEVGK